MLKGIPNIISPELLKILMEMGHGDEIVIGDANYPAASQAQRLVRADGHDVPQLLEAILELFPLDTFETPVHMMEKVKGFEVETPIWDVYKDIIKKDNPDATIKHLPRDEFYKKAKNAYAIVTTTEKSLYACLVLKKGVL